MLFAKSENRKTQKSLLAVRLRRLVAGVAALASLVSLCGSSLPARADQLIDGHDYLYDAPNAPVDVTSRIVTIGGYTYLQMPPGSEEEMVQIILDYSGGHIYDDVYHVIGFIYSAGP